MGVEGVLSSASKVQVLRVLSDSSSAYSPQELEGETTKNISVIYDAVRELEDEGVIRSVKADGRKSYYRLNKDSSISTQVKKLFKAEKEEYSLEELPANLVNIILDAENKLKKKVEGLEMILLFGSMARGDFTPESDIDLYIVVQEKHVEIEDKIYDILDEYDIEFSAVIRDEEGYESDFVDENSKLGRSIVLEGYSIIYNSLDRSIDELYGGIATRYGDKPGENLDEELKSEIVEKLRDTFATYNTEGDKE
jgi:predicted nucleotidyltransferase